MSKEQNSTTHEVQKLTAAELKELGYQVKKVRKPQSWSKTDGKANTKAKLTQAKEDLIAAYKRAMRLADGEFTYNGDKYPLERPSDTQRQWLLDPLVEMHQAVSDALESGVRPKVVTESCPD
jgi:hypothetical protein